MRFCGHCGSPAGHAASAPAAPSEPATDALRSFVTGQVADRLIESGGEMTEERRLVTALLPTSLGKPADKQPTKRLSDG